MCRPWRRPAPTPLPDPEAQAAVERSVADLKHTEGIARTIARLAGHLRAERERNSFGPMIEAVMMSDRKERP